MRRQLLLPAVLLLMGASLPVFARGDNDRASVGSDITVAEGESMGNIACAFCSVHIHGDVTGEVAVAFGSVSVDSGHRISGDTAIFGGDLNLAEAAEAAGEVSVIGGEVNLAPGANIRGARTVLQGRMWILLPLAPLLILIGVIWLVVHVVRRNRYRFPAYPNGRGM